MRRRLLACAALALVSALVGPRLSGPQGRGAGGAFAYEPPEGFVPFKGKVDLQGAKAWVHEDESTGMRARASEEPGASSARVVVHHSTKEMSVEEADLAKLAQEMRTAFEDSCTWTHRRHEMRVRPDGARVGLIEGDCTREIEVGFGLPKQTLRSRKLQLMFPDDAGTSIATASYPTDQAARWEPVFEATIAKAHGVAVRVPAPSNAAMAGWAAAGAVVGWLASAIAFRSRGPKAPGSPSEPPAKRPKASPTDDEGRG